MIRLIGGVVPQEVARFQTPKTKTAIRVIRGDDGMHRAEVFTKIANWQPVDARAAGDLIIQHGSRLRLMFARFPDLFRESD